MDIILPVYIGIKMCAEELIKVIPHKNEHILIFLYSRVQWEISVLS